MFIILKNFLISNFSDFIFNEVIRSFKNWVDNYEIIDPIDLQTERVHDGNSPPKSERVVFLPDPNSSPEERYLRALQIRQQRNNVTLSPNSAESAPTKCVSRTGRGLERFFSQIDPTFGAWSDSGGRHEQAGVNHVEVETHLTMQRMLALTLQLDTEPFLNDLAILENFLPLGLSHEISHSFSV
jgi:hypothetical protein